MIKTLAHVCLFSKDLNRSLDFYCGALGLRRHFDFIKDGELFGFYLQIDRTILSKFSRPARRKPPAASEFIIFAWRWMTWTRCGTR